MALDLSAQILADAQAHLVDPAGGTAANTSVPIVGPSATVRGLFQDESSRGDREGPYAWLLDADVTTAGLAHGATATIDGRSFTVDGRQADGHGWTMLVLESQ